VRSRTGGGAGGRVDLSRPAIFLDTEGTLFRDERETALTPGTIEATRGWHAAGYVLVVVANYPGVARGSYSEEQIQRRGAALREQLGESGIPLEGFYFCPHHPGGSQAGYAVDCVCRKPQPGLILHAAYELNLDLRRSWMIGDGPEDFQAGKRARVNTVLLTHASEISLLQGRSSGPDYVAGDMREAARIVRGASSSWPAANLSQLRAS
jgi:D-glycero-D-manno-heptose 1,7-bisphosphate phosphatase